MVFQPEEAEALVVAHGGGDGEFLELRTVGLLKDVEPKIAGVIAVDGRDEVDVSAVCGEFFNIDSHGQAFHGGLAGVNCLEGSGVGYVGVRVRMNP